jgi:alkylation response protein AidB-like acyl-CoA dehydrogenase
MPTSLIHRQTLEFLLFDWLKADQYLHHGAKQMHNRASLSALLDRAANLAGDKLASCYRQADEHEPVLENGTVRMTPEIRNALHAMRDQGFFGLTQPFEEGGLGLPVLIERACFALFAAANPAVAAYPQISLACARTIQSWGTPAQITQYAAPVFAGKMFGTMCLAEQQAGSSLGDIETRAIPDGPAAYRLFGHKMWVAGGAHTMADNIVHLVLARVPDNHGKLIPGVRGLSLFLVPALIRQANGEAIAQNDISVTGINRTMGYRGLINCSLSFGREHIVPAVKPVRSGG